jgi:aminobenzoyl-glutamate transport protein
MKSKWQMPHPATMFLLLTVVVIIVSWVGDIYGLSVRLSLTGEEIRVQNLLSADGLRWMLQHVISNFTSFTPLGMAVIAIFGLGLAQHSGFIDACIRSGVRHRKNEHKQMIAWVIVLGLISNIVGDAGYVILLPIAATMFRSVGLNPIAGIITSYISVASGYSANLFLSIIDPVLSINTERAAFSSNTWDSDIGPMCNYYFFFASTIVIGILIYYVTCKYLLPSVEKEHSEHPQIDYKPLSRKERRAFHLALTVGIAYFLIILLIAILPLGILRGVDGGLLYSPFTMNILTILSLGIAIIGIVYGVTSGRYRTDRDMVDGLVSAMSMLSIFFVIAFFAAQLYACFSYSHLDRYIAVNFASLLTSISAGPLVTLIFFILFTATVNLVLCSATGKWTFMSFIFVPYFAKIGVSPDIVQCAFRIGDSSTNAITPFLLYMPLVLTYMQQYNKQVTYGTVFRYTWRYTLYILVVWILFFVGWYLLNIPFGR